VAIMTDALPADAISPSAAHADAALTGAAPAGTVPAGDGWPAWAGPAGARAWRAPALAASPLAFHRSLPGYRPTVLADLPELAAELGAGRVFVKDESARLGLPAFKILGASWAIEQALAGRARPPATLVTATDGNHGRAVARVAGQRGLAARIMIPDGVHPSAVAAIAAEGARVVRVSGSYDDAVRHAVQNAAAAGGDALLIQDMAWPGYTEIPAWIVEGYTTMLAEIDEQLAAAGIAGPGLVVSPAGVGSLAQAVIAHYRRPGITGPPALACAEPAQAACVQHSLRAGQLVTIETTESIMAGLNCGTPSTAAWPYLSSGLDAAVAVTDAEARLACADLARLGVPAGPCGAAPLAAARRALATGPGTAGLRRHLGVTSETVIVLLCTEGSAANPAGSPPAQP
jgi:diaminopropionate ammonia-lyase